MAPIYGPSRGQTAGNEDAAAHPGERLLALYPNLRQTGWAVFSAQGRRPVAAFFLAASGTVGPGPRTRLAPQQRIGHQVDHLTAVVEQCRPRCLACSWPGGMDWGSPGMRQLEEHLRRWAESQGIPVVDYPAPEVRAALAGKPNASKGALAYSVMERLNLVGESRSALEWEAIAAGYYHLALRE